MPLSALMPIRIARPTVNLAASERFWVEGVGLSVLWRSEVGVIGGHALLAVGVPGASWHLELVQDAEIAEEARPSSEDLIVLYTGGALDSEDLARIEASGGQRVSAQNPYWDRWGATFVDPDGYRFVLSSRRWP